MQDIMRLCDTVRETGFAIHRYLRNGHLEKVYENALAHRLGKLGLEVRQQHPLGAIVHCQLQAFGQVIHSQQRPVDAHLAKNH